jgi:hypothetical protein
MCDVISTALCDIISENIKLQVTSQDFTPGNREICNYARHDIRNRTASCDKLQEVPHIGADIKRLNTRKSENMKLYVTLYVYGIM